MALASTHVPGPVTVDTVLRLPLQARVRHPLYWRWIRFLIFGRAVPAVLFAEMGWLQVGHLQQAHGVLQAVPRLLYLFFCCIPVGLYLTRPMPVSRDGRLVARAAAFGGTCMQLVIGAFVPLHRLLFAPPDSLIFVASLLSIAAWSTVLPFSTVTGRPSIVSVTVSITFRSYPPSLTASAPARAGRLRLR